MYSYLEVFEAEDVENAHEVRLVLAGVDALVDRVDQPGERPRVQRLRHRVAVLTRLQQPQQQHAQQHGEREVLFNDALNTFYLRFIWRQIFG